jgi:outer membrane protein TolC
VPQVTQPIFTVGGLKSNVNLEKPTIQTAFREVSDALVQYRRVREIRTP